MIISLILMFFDAGILRENAFGGAYRSKDASSVGCNGIELYCVDIKCNL